MDVPVTVPLPVEVPLELIVDDIEIELEPLMLGVAAAVCEEDDEGVRVPVGVKLEEKDDVTLGVTELLGVGDVEAPRDTEDVGVLDIDAESVDVILALTEPDRLTSELTDADVKGENEVTCVAALVTIADTVREVDVDKEAIALVELDTIAVTEVLDEREAAAVLVLDTAGVTLIVATSDATLETVGIEGFADVD